MWGKKGESTPQPSEYNEALRSVGIEPTFMLDDAIVIFIKRFKDLEARVERIERGGY